MFQLQWLYFLQALYFSGNYMFKKIKQFRRGRIRKAEWMLLFFCFFSAVRICTMLPSGKVFNYSRFHNGIRRRGKRDGRLVSSTLQKKTDVPQSAATFHSFTIMKLSDSNLLSENLQDEYVAIVCVSAKMYYGYEQSQKYKGVCMCLGVCVLTE